MASKEVIVVGAGMSGLAAAIHLHRAGLQPVVLEKEGRAGGQVGTDTFDGFTLDRGFQVMLTNYPESEKIFDYYKLGLKTFDRGALVRINGQFKSATRPFSGIYTFFDILKLPFFLRRLSKHPPEYFLKPSRLDAYSAIRQLGFSGKSIERFFRPFFGGVLLDRSLKCPGLLVPFILKMFWDGFAALPNEGLASLADQLVSKLPRGSIRFNHQVIGLEEFKGKPVILAVDPWSLSKLLGTPKPPPGRRLMTYYFSSDDCPHPGKTLFLNGDKYGIVNHAAILSNINPNYAPQGRHLISVNVLEEGIQMGGDHLYDLVLKEMSEWFGLKVYQWRHLHTYSIENAHPLQYPLKYNADNVVLAGAYLQSPSLQSALYSGRMAAEKVIKSIKKGNL